jgi:hypothetical protein
MKWLVLDLGDVKQFHPKIIRPPEGCDSLKDSADMLDHTVCAAKLPPTRRHLDQPSRWGKRPQHPSRGADGAAESGSAAIGEGGGDGKVLGYAMEQLEGVGGGGCISRWGA